MRIIAETKSENLILLDNFDFILYFIFLSLFFINFIIARKAALPTTMLL